MLTVRDSAFRTLYYFDGDRVLDDRYRILLYLKDGFLQDASYRTLFYFDGEKIQDSRYRIRWYLRDGRVEDDRYRTVFYVSGDRIQDDLYRTVCTADAPLSRSQLCALITLLTT